MDKARADRGRPDSASMEGGMKEEIEIWECLVTLIVLAGAVHCMAVGAWVTLITAAKWVKLIKISFIQKPSESEGPI
ncbi:MAG TPA: hypothetical protein ENH57_02115 [Actinobacteria bacterium]|nr:hypothetical protein [Actinomycetota bacterium]